MTALVSLFEVVQPELKQVEQALAATARTEDPIVEPVLSLILPGSGKRLRPALALLAAKLGRFPEEAGIHMAVGVELLHTASLVHDDVVDETDRRRGDVSLFARVGNAVAVLVGDYLFSESAARCVATGDLRVIGLFAQTLGNMTRGQIQEAARNNRAHYTLSRDAYYQTIWDKTASLFVLACQGGALLGGLSDDQVRKLRRFGEKVGLAFQIVDDLLDFVGDEESLGKPVGSDLRQGVVTLPIIYLRDEMQDGAFRQAFERHGVDELVHLVKGSEAVDRCRLEAQTLARESREALEYLPSSPARASLEALSDYVVERLT